MPNCSKIGILWGSVQVKRSILGTSLLNKSCSKGQALSFKTILIALFFWLLRIFMRSHLWWGLTPWRREGFMTALHFRSSQMTPNITIQSATSRLLHSCNQWFLGCRPKCILMNDELLYYFFPKYDIKGKILTFASENSSLKKKRKNEYPSKFCMGIALPLGSKVARKMSLGVILLNIHLTNILRLVSWSTFLIHISFKN